MTTPDHKRYKACDIYLKQSDPQPNHWLLSDQITVSEANRIDITVKYFITSCSNIPPNNGGHYCVNVFDLHVNQSDQRITDQGLYPDPRSNSVAYERVAEIKATDKITSETISILAKENHVILAFHNYGACITLFSVKVTYNVCPDETLRRSLVSLPRTVAPANDSEPTRVEGKCDKGTVQVPGSLYVHCESNGEWNTTGIEGRCICKEEMQNNNGICIGNVVAFTLLSMKMHMRLTIASHILHFIFLDGLFCFLFSFRNIEATLSLSSVSFFKTIHGNQHVLFRSI